MDSAVISGELYITCHYFWTVVSLRKLSSLARGYTNVAVFAVDATAGDKLFHIVGWTACLAALLIKKMDVNTNVAEITQNPTAIGKK